MVEGPEDKIYILTLLQLYSRVKNFKIDLNILSIIDSGGASELPAMARIIGGEDRPCIVLIDSDSARHLKKLRKIILGENNLKEIRDFKTSATVIQELLPPEFYEKAVNKYIDQLLQTESISLLDGVIKRDFSAVIGKRIDQAVEAFVFELFGEESISKVGIANEFEEIVLAPDFECDQYDFKSAFALTEWVIKQLKLEPINDNGTSSQGLG